ncbi:SHOCT domain-containing protein [Cryobacterium zhongshanensis]|uniref:SHOCT domain-containing protein n=1 Tax=Cryobacterium zhongshanensis TaxID=2928153 RepID=A0AA41QV29_9MICO|nr:SHOCT domain-containing protein [Cryobacterium zhongshanensis]MCI4656776.1 SHOCT domain-containing protein [Cryobacterium zhongshanensis]
MDNFWNFVGFFFWSFVFLAYLMVLVTIIGDLFSDHKVSGWVKAVWMIFLVFLPFLTALVYLIARGSGMSERQVQRRQQYRGEADQYIKTVAGTSPSGEIADAKKLLDSGVITQAEYERLKARALG